MEKHVVLYLSPSVADVYTAKCDRFGELYKHFNSDTIRFRFSATDDVPPSSLRDSKWPGCSHVIEKYICDDAYEHFHFPAVGENIFRSRTPINPPLIGRNR